MKKLFALALLAPILALAQGNFDGTWRFDLQKAKLPEKPNTYALQGGMYRCPTCVPKIEVKADGQDQKVEGSPYYDTMSVRVIDDRTIEMVTKKGGKTVGTERAAVSEDGNTRTIDVSFQLEGSDKPVTGRVVERRVDQGPQGAHKTSGSWRTEKYENFSENVLLLTLKSTPDGLSMSLPTGESYTAKFDGKDYPYEGNPGVTAVSLNRIDANTIEETDKLKDEVIAVVRMSVSPDGKTLTMVVDDKKRGTTSTYVAEKQ